MSGSNAAAPRALADEEQGGRRPSKNATPRYTRRLSDKILTAFHQACDQSDYEAADQLLGILETMLRRGPANPDANRRRSVQTLVAAYERLWFLRHPENEQGLTLTAGV